MPSVELAAPATRPRVRPRAAAAVVSAALLLGPLGSGPSRAGEPATRGEVTTIVEALRADPDLKTTRRAKVLRLKPSERAAQQAPRTDPSWWTVLTHWTGQAFAWLAETMRWLIWLLGALAVALIAVSVRHHNEIQIRQVNALRLRVLRKDVRVVASVEQDPFSAVFDKRSIAPVFLHRGCFTECIIENSDLRIAGSGARHWSGEYCRSTLDEKQEYCRTGTRPVIGCHGCPPCVGVVTIRGLGSPEANYTLRNLLSQGAKDGGLLRRA